MIKSQHPSATLPAPLPKHTLWHSDAPNRSLQSAVLDLISGRSPSLCLGLWLLSQNTESPPAEHLPSSPDPTEEDTRANGVGTALEQITEPEIRGPAPIQPTADDVAKPEAKPLPPPEGTNLIVRVIDPSGEVVPGVLVQAVLESTFQMADEKHISSHELDSSLSNTAGLAYLKLKDSLLTALYRPDELDQPMGGAPGTARLGIRTTLHPVLGEDQVEATWLSEEPTLATPIELTLPPFGWLELVGPDPAWDPSGGSQVHLSQLNGVDREWSWNVNVPLADELETTRVPVGLDWQLIHWLALTGFIGNGERPKFDGPVEPGQVVAVHLSLPAKNPVKGRLVDPDGSPFAERGVGFELRDPQGAWAGRGYLKTDEEGRWSGCLADPLPTGTLELELNSDPRKHKATIDLSTIDRGASVIDLGTVTLIPGKPPERLLVSGRVLDEAGEPIRRVQVYAEGPQPADGKARPFRARDQTNKRGEYEIMSQELDLPSTIRVSAYHKKYQGCEPENVIPGSQNIDFVLTQGASIRWVIHTEDDILRWMNLTVSLESDVDHNHSRDLGEGGGHFTGLHAGTHELSIKIRSSSWVFERITVDLAANQHVTPKPVDLTGRTRSLRIQFLNHSGEPAERTGFHIKDAAGRGTNFKRSKGEGIARVLLPTDRGPLTLTVGEETFAIPPKGDVFKVRLGQ